MSSGLHLKYISQWNLENTPIFSYDNNNNYKSRKQTIDKNLPTEEELNENDLVIFCIEEMYGYRTGIFGYISKLLSNSISQHVVSTSVLQNIFNYIFRTKFICDDIEFASLLITLLNRPIPLLNFGVWDDKYKIFKENSNRTVLKNINYNDSMNGMFDVISNLFYSPFFDSGLSILSNKPSYASGFERLTSHSSFSSYKNHGFAWSYFKNDGSNEKGIMAICINLSDNKEKGVKEIECQQMINLVENLKERYSTDVKLYETYIIGDLKINLMETGLSILFQNFQIFNKFETSYLIYNDNNSTTFKKQPALSSCVIDDGETKPFLKYIFNQSSSKKRLFEKFVQSFNANKKFKFDNKFDDKFDSVNDRIPSSIPKSILDKIDGINATSTSSSTPNNDEIIDIDNENDPELEGMPELITDSDDEGDKKRQSSFYKNLNIILNPIDNYLVRNIINSSPESSTTDDEWTKV
jgi:hypothetical protein